MMRTKAKFAAMNGGGGSPAAKVVEVESWEVRPGGMLVQKRNPDSEGGGSVPAPTIRVRVKYGSAYHEVLIGSQASFGELKKLLSERTGLHPMDQKLLFKDKEKESGAFLDTSGVKDRSKIVLVEDPTAQAKRVIEMRRNAKMERASKSISEVSLEVDKLAGQVKSLESLILKGTKVAEKEVLNLIELLMTQLIKLDGIIADGDAKQQRRLQVKRVQKYVETLDVLKIRNAMPSPNEKIQKQQEQQQQQQQKQQQQQPQKQNLHTPAPVVVTTQWEKFDFDIDSIFSTPSTSATSTATSASSTASAAPPPKFAWELF
ncbi:BAG family molecular chaperone regulator 1 [Acorus calamus]|uniref:BAG family molecular chaperone regulator 1 n=1 Tax=Acorus calamus TaxID=4465 RepID=A0AAV9F7Q2_ACOCL|nr:BAG family molecular chaperone regulator 1 [Acorus calamus]